MKGIGIEAKSVLRPASYFVISFAEGFTVTTVTSWPSSLSR